MIADSGLPHKPRRSLFKSLTASLALRIVLICFLFLLIPLLIQNFIIYRHDRKIKMTTLFLSLDIYAKGEELLLREVIHGAYQNLRTWEEVVGVVTQSEQLTPLFSEAGSKEGFASLFYQSLDASGNLNCIASLEPQLIGQRNLFASEMQETLKNGTHTFLAVDPATSIKSLYCSRLISASGKPLGILVVGYTVEELFSRFSSQLVTPYPFTFALVAANGERFVGEAVQNEAIYSPSKGKTLLTSAMEEERAFLENIHHIRSIGIKIPVEGTSFFLLISTPKESLTKFPVQGLTSHLWIYFSAVLILGVLVTTLITRRMARPLRLLNETMQKVGQGSLYARYHADRWGFEINVLGSHFNRMIDAVLTHMEEARKERVKREVLSNELKIGHEIQKSILPKQMPDFPGLDIAASFIPAKEVAGDFYDIFVKDADNNRLMMAIADTCGKGISACLYSLCVRSMLRSYEDSLDDLPTIIRSTNNLFCRDTADTGFFVTAWVGIYNAQQRRLHFTSCGHPAAILRRADGTLHELTTEGTALGVTHFATVTSSSIDLHPGDTLVLYTDGITEATDPDHHFFGKDRLHELLQFQTELSAKALVNRILERVLRFSSSEAIHDDMTVLVIRVL